MKNLDYRLQITEKNKGFVSIFSVLIIMAVLSLIMVGFSQVVRRAAVSNLNDQLSTQAFYAAESGVNAAIAYIKTPGASDKTDCITGPAGSPVASPTNLDSNLAVGYTCVLIKKSAQDIKYSSVPLQGAAAAKTVRFESSNPANPIGRFDVKLDSTSGVGTVASDNNNLPASRAPSDIGMLRVDLAPTSGSLDRNTLVSGNYTFFINFTNNPAVSNSASYTVSPGVNSGNIVYARCSSAPCKTTIRLDGTPAQTYVMRLQAIYSSVSVVVDNVRDLGGNSLITLQNGQALVDVTGHANSVYRRIQVRLPNDSGLTPSFAIDSADSICKLLEVAPGNTTVSDSDPACQLN